MQNTLWKKYLVVGIVLLICITTSEALTIDIKENTELKAEAKIIDCTTTPDHSVFAGNVTGIAFALGDIDSCYYLNDTYLFGPGWVFEYTNGWIRVRSWTRQYGFQFTKLDKNDCNGSQCFLGVLTCNKPLFFGILTQNFVCAIFPIFYKPKIPQLTPVQILNSMLATNANTKIYQ